MSPSQHEEDDLRQLADLLRAHEPPTPSQAAWQQVFDRVASALPAKQDPRGAGWWGPVCGAALVAAVLGLAVLLPPPPSDPAQPADEVPFAVAATGEIFILKADPADADRIALGQPVMGAFEVTAPGEVVMVGAEANPDGLTAPRLHRSGRVTMIITSDEDDEPQ